MEISFYARESKVNRKGYTPIQMSVCLNGERVFISLPRKEKPEDFKRLTQSKKNNDLKEYLEVTRHLVNRAVTQILQSGRSFTLEALREYMKNGGIRSYTIEDMFNDFLRIKQKSGNETMYYKYTIVQKDFYDYIQTERLSPKNDVNTITNLIITGFYAHLLRTAAPSTTAGKMTKLKAVVMFAINGDRLHINPFNQVIIRKPKPNIEYLTEAQLDTIRKKDLHCERLNRVRDLFLFQAASGLSYADMASIGDEDGTKVEECDGFYKVKGRRQKTGVEFCALLLEDGERILRKYDGKLPVLSNQRYNAYLKEIQEVSGCNVLIHSHLARKTYATRCLNRGIRAEVLKNMLGHTTTKLTLSTYAHLEDDTILKEAKEAFERRV